MTRDQLIERIHLQRSFLCVGLDTDLSKIPSHLQRQSDPVLTFNKAVIDATRDHCVAYKPNIAFYESMGKSGWEVLEKTLDYIPGDYFTIADAKRGDIGNTSSMYARTFFETYNFDAITVAPYMGSDSILPFLEFEDKWVIVLALTSNPGSRDFQFFEDSTGLRLFEKVLETTVRYGTTSNLMFVVGATQAEYIARIRDIVPDHFLLIPGVGSQGGDLGAVYQYGHNEDVGLLVNASRSIIYAGGDDPQFAAKVGSAAHSISNRMSELLKQ